MKVAMMKFIFRSKVEGTEQSFRVLRIVRHPDHNPTTKDSDITLLELNQGATLNKYVGLACLPTEEPKLKLESTCFITGRKFTNIISIGD